MSKEKSEEKPVGKVISYYSKINVAAINLEGSLKVGDKIRLKGHTTDFEQTVDSMQIEHKKVEKAKKGDSIGIKVAERVRPNDMIYKA